MDGLFLLLTVLLIALVFALYLVFMIRRAMAAVSRPAAQKSKAGAPPRLPGRHPRRLSSHRLGRGRIYFFAAGAFFVPGDA